MAFKNLIKRGIAFLLLGLFLVSTSGMVMYYHFCQYSNEVVVSVYVDSTAESCSESAHHKIHEDLHTCAGCCTVHEEDKCCDDHQTNSKTAKLDIPLSFSNEEIAIEPSTLELPFENIKLELRSEIVTQNNSQYYNFKEHKPIPIYGRDLVTYLNTFKVYC